MDIAKGYAELDWICDNAQRPEANNYRAYCDWYAWNQDQKSMEAEAAKVSTVRNQLGWSQGRMFKRIGSMPLHIFVILKRMDREFASNTADGRKKYLKFILRRPEFAVH